MTTNATRLVDDFGPFYRVIWWLFQHATPLSGFGESELYHANKETKHASFAGGQSTLNHCGIDKCG